MFRQKTVIFLAIAALMAVVIACSSSPKPTASPVPPTDVPVPTATATPVPVAPIEIDPITDPVGFLSMLPADEATCAIDAVGGRDRVIAMMSSSLGDDRLTVAEANALDNCLSEDTVNAIFIGQLSREAGGLSDDTIVCIGEQIGGMSAAGLFLEEPAADVIISSLKGVFCLASDERARISASEAAYGFGELGGIDALECVVNGVGPTGLTDLVDVFSGEEYDFEALGDLFPLMIECGAVDDSEFEELGVSADQIGCVLGELGEDGLALFDQAAGEPDLSDLGALLGTLSNCGIELDDLMGASELPINPGDLIDPVIIPTVQLELPEDLADVELPFTEEQIICLSTELGEDQIANLLEGGAPDLSLFSALSKCEVDLSVLLGG
jgi:hypothetical protein